MTIRDIKNELEHRLKAASEAKDTLYKHRTVITWVEQSIIGALELLEQLSAPELVWEQKNENVWEANTPICTYRIWLDDTWYYVLVLGGDFLKVKGSIEEAKSAAQTHWNELYLQIINL